MPSRTKRSSLADQLASLADPTPIDIDPENAENYVDSDSEASAASEEVDDSRSHYAEVGKSRLRDVANEKPIKASYKGQKSSRKAIFEGDSEDEELDDDVHDDGEDGSQSESEDEEESGSEGDMAAFDQIDVADEENSVSISSSGSDQSELSDDDSESESETNSEDERQAAELKKMLADDEKAMVQDVVKTATADAEKGKAVKKQLSMYDSLLDSRIKMQKGLQNINLISDTPDAALDSHDVKQAEHSALAMIDSLFDLRCNLMAQDGITLSTSKKRTRDDGSDYDLSEIWVRIKGLDSDLSSWRDGTLTKWSDKIQAASGIDKGKKFKALSQGILAQIDESKSAREKLLRRTQIKRFKANSKTTMTNDDLSTNIYDDGDFYQEMLKDLIDSRMLDSTNGNGVKWVATKQPKQKKANVDTRASKGRKLRYHVHEKIQNFMAPIPTGTWHEEQVDELFGSLLGQRLRVDEGVVEDDFGEDDQQVETVEVGDDFRLFG